jgi:hypothetical protein
MTHVVTPFSERDSHITHVRFGLLIQNPSIQNFDSQWFPAIKTGKIHRHRLAGKKPADRQRFKSSLAEPLLLPVYGNAVLGGKIVERRKGDDVVRARIQPSGDAGAEKVVKRFSPLFDSQSQLGGKLRVERRLARFHHALHDEMKGLIQKTGLTHDPSLLSASVLFHFRLLFKNDPHRIGSSFLNRNGRTSVLNR